MTKTTNSIKKYGIFTAITLSVVFLFSFLPRTFAAETHDKEILTSATSVPCSDWAKDSIEKAIELNIINYGGNYNYPTAITRKEFCEFVYNTINAVLNKTYTINTSFKFEDTDNEAVIILNRLGIINGKTETEFAPNDYLTREEAATIIIRMINNLMPMPVTEMWFDYDDTDEISQWASDSVQIISNLGFMQGTGDNKFAPKTVYTTEQAIATLVRVYESAKETGITDESESLNIIGGADGPTSIIIRENINMPEKNDFDDFCFNLSENTISVKEFYINEAIKLISESKELASDKDFISLYTTNDEMTNKILDLASFDYKTPANIFYLSAEYDKIITNIKVLLGEEAENIDFEKLAKINKKYNFSTLASLINSSYGTENLAALTILTNSRGYVMPQDFKNNFALFIQYNGEYSAIVSFSEYGDKVISANMSFVKNGDTDNVFKRLYEIISAVGEDGITVAKVK